MSANVSPAKPAPPARLSLRDRRGARREFRRAQRQARQEELEAALAASRGEVRLGTLGLRSAWTYLVVWTLVVFGVLLLVLCGGYAALWVLGVVASVSRSLAAVLSQPLPESGVLPYLAPHAVLPIAVVASAVLAVLWLVSSLAVVLIHNAVSSLTGGPSVRLH